MTAKRRILRALADHGPLTVDQLHAHTKVRRGTIDMTLGRLREARAVIRTGSRRGGQHQITAVGRDMLRGKVAFDVDAVINQARNLPNSVFALAK